jgi:hypothetical protein
MNPSFHLAAISLPASKLKTPDFDALKFTVEHQYLRQFLAVKK